MPSSQLCASKPAASLCPRVSSEGGLRSWGHAASAVSLTHAAAPAVRAPSTDTFIQKTKKLYLDTRTQRNLAKLNQDIAEVHSIMTRNIQEVLGQGERLDSECGRGVRGRRWGGVLRSGEGAALAGGAGG